MRFKNYLKLIIVAALFVPLVAFSQQGVGDLNNYIDTQLPSASAVKISVLRDVLKEIVISYYNLTDDNVVLMEFSEDGAVWHLEPTSADRYTRASVNGGVSWSPAMLLLDGTTINANDVRVTNILPAVDSFDAVAFVQVLDSIGVVKDSLDVVAGNVAVNKDSIDVVAGMDLQDILENGNESDLTIVHGAPNLSSESALLSDVEALGVGDLISGYLPYYDGIKLDKSPIRKTTYGVIIDNVGTAFGEFTLLELNGNYYDGFFSELAFSANSRSGILIESSLSQTYNISGGYYRWMKGTTDFSTDIGELMRLTAAGNLLLNTTTDNGYKFQVNGSISSTALKLTAGAGDGNLFVSDAGGYLMPTAKNAIPLSDFNTTGFALLDGITPFTQTQTVSNTLPTFSLVDTDQPTYAYSRSYEAGVGVESIYDGSVVNVITQTKLTDKTFYVPFVNYRSASDPVAGVINGMQYYNTTDEEFRFRENGGWVGLGGITKIGTPLASQVGIWTADGLEGNPNLTFDGWNLLLSSGKLTSATLMAKSSAPKLTFYDTDSDIFTFTVGNGYFSLSNETDGAELFSFTNTHQFQLGEYGAGTYSGTAAYNLSIDSNGKVIETPATLYTDFPTAPSSSSDTGTTGEIRVTTTYIYVCTATDTWKRTAIATW